MILCLPLFILPHPVSGKKISWIELGERALVILVMEWGMIVFVSVACRETLRPICVDRAEKNEMLTGVVELVDEYDGMGARALLR